MIDWSNGLTIYGQAARDLFAVLDPTAEGWDDYGEDEDARYLTEPARSANGEFVVCYAFAENEDPSWMSTQELTDHVVAVWPRVGDSDLQPEV